MHLLLRSHHTEKSARVVSMFVFHGGVVVFIWNWFWWEELSERLTEIFV